MSDFSSTFSDKNLQLSWNLHRSSHFEWTQGEKAKVFPYWLYQCTRSRVKQVSFVWTVLSLMGEQTEAGSSASDAGWAWTLLALRVIFHSGWRRVWGASGEPGFTMCSAPLCKVQRTWEGKKNKQKRRERTGRGRETQGNMSWILSTGYRICCVWRPLVGSREIYDSSLVPGQFRTSTGIFLLFMWRGTKVVKVQNRRHKSAYTATVTQPERGLELGRSRARRLMAAASERRFKLAGAHTWPPRQNGNQKGDYHLHLQHVTDLTWERERERRWTQIPSPLQKQPFSCCGSYELCYREEKFKKNLKRERMEGKGERVSGERGNPKRFIPFLFSLRVAFPLCLVPLLLNLTIKQHCKNRMFLAGAQQWQSGEGRRTIH